VPANLKLIIRFSKLIRAKRLALVLLGSALLSIPAMMEVAYPLIVRRIIDTLETMRSLRADLILLLALLYGSSTLLAYIGDFTYLRNKYLAAEEMRSEIFRLSMNVPVSKFRTRGSAYFAKLIGDQVNNSFVILDYSFITSIFMLIRASVALSIVFTWNPLICMLFVLNGFLVVAYGNLLNCFTRPLYQRYSELARTTTAYIVETLENLNEVLIGEAIEKRLAGNRSQLAEMTSVSLRGEMRRSGLEKVMLDAPASVTRIVVLLVATGAVIEGHMTIGTLWAIWTYFALVLEPLAVFRRFSRIAMESTATIESVVQYVNEARELSGTLNGKPDANCRLLYSLRDICLRKGDQMILDHLNLSVSSGEVLGVIGLSGEGKSTLLSILLGLERDYSGTAEFLGADIRDTSAAAILSLIGCFSQSIGIFNDDLSNNIVMGRRVNQERLESIVTALGLGELTGRSLGESGAFISGGERQKVQLARLLYANKPFFILDEPLTNLDALTERRLLDVLVWHVRGKSGLIISHKPGVLMLADKFVVLKDGHVLGEGTLADLLQGSQMIRDLASAWVDNAEQIRDLLSGEVMSPKSWH
jgi:ATP-binding cassette subfamily C protein